MEGYANCCEFHLNGYFVKQLKSKGRICQRTEPLLLTPTLDLYKQTLQLVQNVQSLEINHKQVSLANKYATKLQLQHSINGLQMIESNEHNHVKHLQCAVDQQRSLTWFPLRGQPELTTSCMACKHSSTCRPRLPCGEKCRPHVQPESQINFNIGLSRFFFFFCRQWF